jgi:hypothetical protein
MPPEVTTIEPPAKIPVEAPKSTRPKFEDLFEEVELGEETKALKFPWFTQRVIVEPGEPLDIPQPVMSGWVAIAMHKLQPASKGFSDRVPGYFFDYDNPASSVYTFDGQAIDGFKPKQNHVGYTAYFLEMHLYDPDAMSARDSRRLDALQIKQAGLIPRDLSESEEDALSAGKAAPKGIYQRAARSVVTYKPDERAELMAETFALKLQISAGLAADAVTLIEPLKRSRKLEATLMDQIAKFEEVPEDPKAEDSGKELNE